jgi:hypothetical protein
MTEAATAARKTVAALTGDNGATPEQIQSRATQCRECPSRVRQAGIDWCGKPFNKTDTTCGCVVWAKIRVRSEECPQGKW